MIQSLRDAVPRLAASAAALAFLYDAPHLLFDANYARASDHPLYIFHAAMGILSMIVLVAVVGGLLIRIDGRTGGRLPAAAGILTLSGLVMVAGGTWGEGFMIPYLADIDPAVFAGSVGGLLLGIIVLGGLLVSSGWVLMAVALARASLLSKGWVWALGGAAILALVPLPLTTFAFVAVLAFVTRALQPSSVANAARTAPVPARASGATS